MTSKAESLGGYQIDSYDCYYRVSEDNTYHVIETIKVTFLEPRHGIYRQIPEVNQIERLDGSQDTVIAKIDVTSCSDTYTDYRDGSDRVIKLGDSDVTLTGQHTYTIGYDVEWGPDRVEGEDEFYMNLIGDGWDVDVNNLTFTIEMPKEFKDTGKNIGFYYGNYRNSKIDGIQYSFDGKTIRGSLVGYAIPPGAFFTTRIQLEDGYFTKVDRLYIAGVIALILCCVFLTVSLILWMVVGRDKDVIDIVEFYPPDGLNCGEMAYAYYGSLSNKDLVPMVIGLAAKGYISIEQTNEKGSNFVFRLIRGYTGADESEKEFMDGLLKYGAIVTKSELENSFYKTLNKVNETIVKALKPKIFVKSTLLWRLLTFVFAFIPYMVGVYGISRFYLGSFLMAIIFPVAMYACVTVVSVLVLSKKGNVGGKIAILALGIIVVLIVLYFFGDALKYAGAFYWVVFFGCIVANIFQVMFYRIIDKRTDYGIDLLGRIRGFRNYLMTAVRPHLVSLVEQDPAYFYKILPYTYVLGITDKWVKQFESIALEPPEWYFGYHGSTFDCYTFSRFMNQTIQSTQAAMTSTPGGSSSGGGFSGGGGGGGGGGSW